MFKPYVYVGFREEDSGEVYKAFEVFEVSRWGRFLNWLFGEERYVRKEVCRVIMGCEEE